MDLIAGESLAAEVVSLTETSQRSGGRLNGFCLTKDGLQALYDKILDGGAAARCGNFGSLEDAVREINRRFHWAINT
jgi:hypothetical protein